jgi:isoamylase
MADISTARGRPLPLGASRAPDGVNFAVLSRHATEVTLVIFPEAGGITPLATFQLDPRLHRTGDHWHLRVTGLPDVFQYGWRVDGPKGGEHRFDPTRLLIDPFANTLSEGAVWGGHGEPDPERTARRSLFTRHHTYDWGDDAPLRIPPEDSIVYELHVRGFTIHPSSGVKFPGTFRGLIEKIPYLKWLGVTTVELLPVFEFDERDCPFTNPESGQKLLNFWGYNPIGFAAPKAAYAASGRENGEDAEFRDLVKALHAAGIEVILDVVFNHTGEGDDRGRTYHLRGLDNGLYYLLDSRGHYLNYSGTGNTVNCNHPAVREQILTCLRYWVTDMHIDGFRFDLASVLGRDRTGQIIPNPPAVEMIADDGILAHTKLIAEPWDAGGAYQVGRFPFGHRWAEWNDRFRDDVRRFWRGDLGFAALLASRLSGSGDLFGGNGRGPRHSLNFVTCHDGFTLHDLVSYNVKHNAANGEDGRDGHNDNCSWNSGAEGDTADPKVLKLRERRAKSMMVTLLLSQGTPMILAGDEMLRTQKGNNNAWCQDNELGWLDWGLKGANAGFVRFVRELIWVRRKHPVFRRKGYLKGELTPLTADVRWHGRLPNLPNFGPDSRFVAYTLDGRYHGRDDLTTAPDRDFYVALNGGPEVVTATVPPSPTGRRWRRLFDTAAASPDDIFPDTCGPVVKPASVITIAPYAAVALISED